jgi:hypothetical protein
MQMIQTLSILCGQVIWEEFYSIGIQVIFMQIRVQGPFCQFSRSKCLWRAQFVLDHVFIECGLQITYIYFI